MPKPTLPAGAPRFRAFSGNRGRAGWTTKKDAKGWYWSFEINPDAMSGQLFISQISDIRAHRKRWKAKARAYKLAFGSEYPHRQNRRPKKQIAEEFDPMEAWCLGEGKRVRIEQWTEGASSEGHDLLTADCPSCGRSIIRFGKMPQVCCECEQVRHSRDMPENDYICRFCREKNPDNWEKEKK